MSLRAAAFARLASFQPVPFGSQTWLVHSSSVVTLFWILPVELQLPLLRFRITKSLRQAVPAEVNYRPHFPPCGTRNTAYLLHDNINHAAKSLPELPDDQFCMPRFVTQRIRNDFQDDGLW